MGMEYVQVRNVFTKCLLSVEVGVGHKLKN